jgi:amino acid transporter
MDTTTGPAATPAPARLFSRESSGFVRVGTPWRMVLMNVANIGVVYIMFTYWIHPAVFPKSNLVIAIPIATALAIFFNLLYGMLSSIMPRTGSEYVFLTRTFHPVIGFMASFAAATSQMFWVGIGGYWIAQFVLGPMFTSYGAISGSSTIASIGEWASSPTTWFWFGTAFVILMALLNFFGLRAYLRFQDINWVVGAVTGILLLGILVLASNATFQSNWDAYATSTGIATYDQTVQLARGSGMPTGFGIYDTLGIVAVLWLVSWASTYIGGEVRTPNKTQLRATVGGYLLYAGIAWLLILAITRSVSLDFNQAAAWLSYNFAGDQAIELSPTFLLYSGLLIDNMLIFLLAAAGLVLWSYFWIPSAMIIATRAMFSWSFDRLMPEKVSAVHPRYNSPYVAVIIVSVVAELFLILYHQGVFQWLAPALAYFFVFWLVSLCGLVFPYLKRTRPLWENSAVNWRWAGIPVMSICGAVGLILFGLAIYFSQAEDLLFLNSAQQRWTTFAQFAIPFVAFFLARAVRRSQGVPIDATFREIPPE